MSMPTLDIDNLTVREKGYRILLALGICAVLLAVAFGAVQMQNAFAHIPFVVHLLWWVILAISTAAAVVPLKILGPVLIEWSGKGARKSTDQIIARLRLEGAFVAPEQRAPEQATAHAIAQARYLRHRLQRKRMRNMLIAVLVVILIVAMVI